ncbi:hypothetical protein C8R45DRAFT_1075166 [Mycena sanguinolenta]|nr:hypothetical protein C8R45DRAFT_1075166 [Mycena sanguinolenta]
MAILRHLAVIQAQTNAEDPRTWTLCWDIEHNAQVDALVAFHQRFPASFPSILIPVCRPPIAHVPSHPSSRHLFASSARTQDTPMTANLATAIRAADWTREIKDEIVVDSRDQQDEECARMKAAVRRLEGKMLSRTRKRRRFAKNAVVEEPRKKRRNETGRSRFWVALRDTPKARTRWIGVALIALPTALPCRSTLEHSSPPRLPAPGASADQTPSIDIVSTQMHAKRWGPRGGFAEVGCIRRGRRARCTESVARSVKGKVMCERGFDASGLGASQHGYEQPWWKRRAAAAAEANRCGVVLRAKGAKVERLGVMMHPRRTRRKRTRSDVCIRRGGAQPVRHSLIVRGEGPGARTNEPLRTAGHTQFEWDVATEQQEVEATACGDGGGGGGESLRGAAPTNGERGARCDVEQRNRDISNASRWDIRTERSSSRRLRGFSQAGSLDSTVSAVNLLSIPFCLAKSRFIIAWRARKGRDCVCLPTSSRRYTVRSAANPTFVTDHNPTTGFAVHSAAPESRRFAAPLFPSEKIWTRSQRALEASLRNVAAERHHGSGKRGARVHGRVNGQLHRFFSLGCLSFVSAELCSTFRPTGLESGLHHFNFGSYSSLGLYTIRQRREYTDPGRVDFCSDSTSARSGHYSRRILDTHTIKAIKYDAAMDAFIKDPVYESKTGKSAGVDAPRRYNAYGYGIQRWNRKVDAKFGGDFDVHLDISASPGTSADVK